jgi:Icc-related predicted phosphoesterase
VPFWRRASIERDLRIFFASDIHGSGVCFRKFVNAARFYEANVIILGGDITGKAMVPIVREGGGRFRVRFMGEDRVLGDEELPNLQEKIRFNGFYPYLCEPDEVEAMGSDSSRLDAAFTSVMREQVEGWIELADDRLEGSGVRCLVMPGNDDEDFLEELLAKAKNIENHDGRILDIEGYQVIGHGWSNPTPWHTPREKSEPEIEADLRDLLGRVDMDRPVILNAHVPPHASGLDLAPELRPDFTIAMRSGSPTFVPVGSTAVRTVVEQFQPGLVLSGHIHESRGVKELGRSVCVNPGSEYNVGRLLGALIDVKGGMVAHTQLLTG